MKTIHWMLFIFGGLLLGIGGGFAIGRMIRNRKTDEDVEENLRKGAAAVSACPQHGQTCSTAVEGDATNTNGVCKTDARGRCVCVSKY